MDPNRFFSWHIDPYSLSGEAIALVLAVVLGGLVGFERELRGQAAGLRTHILVCVGSTLITLTSVQIGVGVAGSGRGDPARLAAQIVSGIGFLGAGAILREGITIHGLTTAASVWVTAGIGIAIGAGPRVGEMAVIATLLVLGTLVVLDRLEDVLHIKQRIRTLAVEVKEAENGPARVMAILERYGITIIGLEKEIGKADGRSGEMATTRRLRMHVRLPGGFNSHQFARELAEEPGIVSFHLE